MSERTGTVVVGHDGSPSASQALAWAAAHAHRVHARLLVIRAWSVTTAPRPATWKLGYMPPFEDFAAAVRDGLAADVGPVVAGVTNSIEVEYQTFHGPAANGLLLAAEAADLLVVGARGRGGFRGLALGSVSAQCVQHAACPVVVVRGSHSAQTDRTQNLDESFDQEA